MKWLCVVADAGPGHSQDDHVRAEPGRERPKRQGKVYVHSNGNCVLYKSYYVLYYVPFT